MYVAFYYSITIFFPIWNGLILYFKLNITNLKLDFMPTLLTILNNVVLCTSYIIRFKK